jgi:hypothetical protein
MDFTRVSNTLVGLGNEFEFGGFVNRLFFYIWTLEILALAFRPRRIGNFANVFVSIKMGH